MPRTKKDKSNRLSHAEKILISIYKVCSGKSERVPVEDIVLQVWHDFPDDFSLPNHPEHPDASVILKRLYSNLITKRLVVSLRNGIYRLSDKGLLESQKIIDEINSSINIKNGDIELDRDEERFLDNVLRSKTFSIWKNGRKDELIDYDVRVFFQFSTGTPIKERKRRMETAKEVIRKAKSLNLPDAKDLEYLTQFLITKFPQLFEEN